MTKEELAKYAGLTFYNLSRRPGGKYRDINCLVEYRVTERGTCEYIREVLSCVANKKQYEMLNYVTNGVYHVGRPTANTLTIEFLDKISK